MRAPGNQTLEVQRLPEMYSGSLQIFGNPVLEVCRVPEATSWMTTDSRKPQSVNLQTSENPVLEICKVPERALGKSADF